MKAKIKEEGIMKAIDLIARHEGYRKHIYKCTADKNTIGYGFNLDAGMSEEVARLLLEFQVEEITQEASRVYLWFKKLDSVRQAVVVNMIYNLGENGFSKFKNTISNISNGEYALAATAMLNSRWAKQVGGRATELSEMMRSGEWPN